jgi:hypothetical protein
MYHNTLYKTYSIIYKTYFHIAITNLEENITYYDVIRLIIITNKTYLHGDKTYFVDNKT